MNTGPLVALSESWPEVSFNGGVSRVGRVVADVKVRVEISPLVFDDVGGDLEAGTLVRTAVAQIYVICG